MTLKQTEYIRTNTSNNISLLYAKAAARGEVEKSLKYAESFKAIKQNNNILGSCNRYGWRVRESFLSTER